LYITEAFTIGTLRSIVRRINNTTGIITTTVNAAQGVQTQLLVLSLALPLMLPATCTSPSSTSLLSKG
jgi:hypothetical protein